MYIAPQLKLHPSITPRDVLKMCFQATFGAEHLITDVEKAQGYFDAEYEATPPTQEPLFEMIGGKVCRVNIGAWKRENLPREWMFNLFIQGASQPMGSDQIFFEKVQAWENYARENALDFTPDALKVALGSYLATCEGKLQAIHHSPEYKAAEKPAYRVVSGIYATLMPIFDRIKTPQGIIAIEGMAAGGKSTLAKAINAVTGASIIHMDDFFLPAHMRTPLRFTQAGGNIHHERFALDILPHLHTGFEYKIFDCSKMDYHGTRKVPDSPWKIVEGTYSHHPNFEDYATIKVFVEISSELQMSRIIKRNGESMAKRFEEEWIPMEDKYFKQCQIRQKADIIIK